MIHIYIYTYIYIYIYIFRQIYIYICIIAVCPLSVADTNAYKLLTTVKMQGKLSSHTPLPFIIRCRMFSL